MLYLNDPSLVLTLFVVSRLDDLPKVDLIEFLCQHRFQMSVRRGLPGRDLMELILLSLLIAMLVSRAPLLFPFTFILFQAADKTTQ